VNASLSLRLARFGWRVRQTEEGWELTGNGAPACFLSEESLVDWLEHQKEPGAMQPYYQDSLVTLYHGRCEDVMPTLAAQSFDAVICDPPYGTTNNPWDVVIPFDFMWREIGRTSRQNAAIALFGNEPFSSLLRTSAPTMYRYDWVWNKSRPSGFLDANRKPLNDHELISVFYELQPTYNPQMWKGLANHIADGKVSNAQKASQYGNYHNLVRYKSDDKYPRKVLHFASLDPANMAHPNQKPLALLEYLVKTYTNPGDTVLDFTSGSGTTLRACKNLGRKCVGIEMMETYCEATVVRLAPTFEQAWVDEASDLSDLPLFAAP
jgi:DNA modification methylase